MLRDGGVPENISMLLVKKEHPLEAELKQPPLDMLASMLQHVLQQLSYGTEG